MALQAAKLAGDLSPRLPFISEQVLLAGIASLQAGEIAHAVKEFSEALKLPASVTEFGIRLRKFVAAEPQLWVELDKHAPGLRRVIIRHFPSLGASVTLFLNSY